MQNIKHEEQQKKTKWNECDKGTFEHQENNNNNWKRKNLSATMNSLRKIKQQEKEKEM